MAAVGNRVANDYWEAKIPADFEFPNPTDTYQMSTFIRHKYVSKKWAGDGQPPGATSFEPPKPALVRRSSLKQPPGPAPQPRVAPTQPATRSISDNDLGGFFGPESPRKRTATLTPASPPTVSSPTRKPGRQMPQRLARKMKGTSALPAPKQAPPSAGSEPNLASFLSSDDEDPFA
jgi:stromal membrane-associated protein